MEALKILIIEDQTLTAMDLRETLLEAGHTVTAIARNLEQALKAVKTEPPDLALIDIHLGEAVKPDGIGIARELLLLLPMPIIYLTANSEPDTFRAARDTQPAAYLLKPFRAEELIFNIELAYHSFRANLVGAADEPASEQLFLPIGRGHEMINLNDVLYVEAAGAYATIFLADRQSHTISTNLSHVAQYFRTPNFFRLSRFHLVNLNYIKRLKDSGLVLTDNTVLQIPAISRKDLMKRLTVVKTK